VIFVSFVTFVVQFSAELNALPLGP
jgi:hypothetical protein